MPLSCNAVSKVKLRTLDTLATRDNPGVARNIRLQIRAAQRGGRLPPVNRGLLVCPRRVTVERYRLRGSLPLGPLESEDQPLDKRTGQLDAATRPAAVRAPIEQQFPLAGQAK